MSDERARKAAECSCGHAESWHIADKIVRSSCDAKNCSCKQYEPEAGARESQPKNPTDDVYALDKFWEWAEQSGVNGAVRIEHKQRVDEVAVAYAAHCLRQHQEREERLKRALACFDVPEKLGKEWDEAVESAYSVGAMKKLRIAGEHVATWFFNAKQKAAAIRKEVDSV